MLCCLVELHKSDRMKTTVNISLFANERVCMEKNNNNKTTGTTWSKCQVFNELQDLNWTVLELPVNLVPVHFWLQTARQGSILLSAFTSCQNSLSNWT